MRVFRHVAALFIAVFLFACGGGGDSTSTTISGSGLNSLGQNRAVTINSVQVENNMLVSVSDGPRSFQLAPNANILYATVTVCSPLDTSKCVDIDHVQVDTGSVGLRVLASKVKDLKLQSVEISANPVLNAWECFPFVIGGLWGANVKAVVGLGLQKTGEIAIQVIQDDPKEPTLQPTADCIKAADNNILASAGTLGSNGILGIGSTNLDCGSVCLDASYFANNTFVQYYGCPTNATSNANCSTTTGVDAPLQVSNPVSAFVNTPYRDGVVLAMPGVTNPGAASASGELIFGLNTRPNNTLPLVAKKVMLGVDVNNMNAYLNITTQLMRGANVQTFDSSYLDTGTNGLFFNDTSPFPIARCLGSTWYCPPSLLTLDAIFSDGGSTTQNVVGVQFQVANAEALFATSNTAFSGASGAAPAGSTSFAWGMPFFYGKRVYMSIWDITSSSGAGPWYAWTAL